MYEKKILAIIPARSGSKGVKDKNIKNLKGKPLISYTIESALKSEMFDEVMVSTDSARYAEISKINGAEVPFLRSESNSSDDASSWDMVREVLLNYKKIGKTFDVVCLLQPTSPLRDSQDIKNAFNLFFEKKADTVVAVSETSHSPLWSNTLDNNLSMDNFIKSDNMVPRQQIEKYYIINGSIYIVNANKVINNENIYSNSFAYIMDQKKSVDIDTELDFFIVETLLRYNRDGNI